MGYKVSKNLPYQILFALCVGVTYINIYELTLAVWIFAVALTVRKKYSLGFLQHILPFFLILLVAFITYFSYDNSVYDAIRDVTYMIKPIVGLLIGYQLCKNHDIKPFETIIYTGLFIAIVHLGFLFYNFAFYRIINIHVLRGLAGYFSDFEVYSLILVVFYKQLKLNFSRQHFWTLVSIIGISSFLYLSRTNFIQFVVLYVGMKGYYSLNKKTIKIFAWSALVLVVGYTIVYNTNPTRNGKGLEALLFKIKNAPIEPFKTKVDKNDYEDFNDNYRSYENIITIKQVSLEGIDGVLFGKGLGSSIDIGRKMLTNDGTYVRHEPIVHNGYMTVFMKSGLVGVLFLLYFLYILTRQKRSAVYEVEQINFLLIATGVFLIISNWVLLGLYLKLDNKSIIIGFLLSYKEMLIKQKSYL